MTAATTVAGVAITHPDRFVFPAIKFTKLDLARYYARVAPLMLPFVRNRPLSIVRCPEGMAGKCFFQKHWPANDSAPISTALVMEDSGEAQPYAVVRTRGELVALVQMGMVELHLWGSRVDAIERPDRMVFDLDPGPHITFTDVRNAAHQLRHSLSSRGLESWVKLTGGTGLHVVVPVERRITWAACSLFARTVAEHFARESPDRFVSQASKELREGRIFIDWLRNTRGATSVAPWSVRARDGAPISMPVSWGDLDTMRDSKAFTVREHSAVDRYAKDWAPMATLRQRLSAATIRRPAKGLG